MTKKIIRPCDAGRVSGYGNRGAGDDITAHGKPSLLYLLVPFFIQQLTYRWSGRGRAVTRMDGRRGRAGTRRGAARKDGRGLQEPAHGDGCEGQGRVQRGPDGRWERPMRKRTGGSGTA